jgi:hypothetical protein
VKALAVMFNFYRTKKNQHGDVPHLFEDILLENQTVAYPAFLKLCRDFGLLRNKSEVQYKDGLLPEKIILRIFRQVTPNKVPLPLSFIFDLRFLLHAQTELCHRF